MKLSDVRGERVFDVIADIIDPLASIASSGDVRDLMNPKPCPEGMDPREFMLDRIRKTIPSVIRTHKSEAVAVLSSIEGVTADEYLADLSLPKLIADVTELMTDEAFTDFLSSVKAETDELPSTSD